MKNKWILLIFPLIGVVGMVLVLLGGSQENPTRPTPISLNAIPTPIPIRTTPVPTVTVIPIIDNLAPLQPLTDLEGNTFTLADLTDQIVILNFWATWCQPCVEEMPLLQDYAASHPDVVLLAVTDPNDGQSPEEVQAFIKTYQLTDLRIAFDENALLRLNFNAPNLPMTFVLDRQNYVRFRQIGAVTTEDLDYYVRAVTE